MEDIYTSFTENVKSGIQPAEIKAMISELEDLLDKSKETRKEIVTLYENCYTNKEMVNQTANTPNTCDDILQLLHSKCKILLPDMEENFNLDVEETINKINAYAKEIKTSCIKTSVSYDDFNVEHQPMSSLDFEEYAAYFHSFNQSLKRLNIVKNEANTSRRNLEVEEKLQKLSEDTELFTKMVKARTTLAGGSEKWSNKEAFDSHSIFDYSEIVDKIIAKTKEVSYILSKKNKH